MSEAAAKTVIPPRGAASCPAAGDAAVLQSAKSKTAPSLVIASRFLSDHDLGGLDHGQHLVAHPEAHPLDRAARDDRDQLLVADRDSHLRHHAVHRDRQHAPAQLIPGAQVHAGGRAVRRRTQRPLEVLPVEEPLPADSPARETAVARQRLDPLDVEVEEAGCLVGAHEVA